MLHEKKPCHGRKYGLKKNREAKRRDISLDRTSGPVFRRAFYNLLSPFRSARLHSLNHSLFTGSSFSSFPFLMTMSSIKEACTDGNIRCTTIWRPSIHEKQDKNAAKDTKSCKMLAKILHVMEKFSKMN